MHSGDTGLWNTFFIFHFSNLRLSRTELSETSFKTMWETTLHDRYLVKSCSQRKVSSFCRTWNWNSLGLLCCAKEDREGTSSKSIYLQNWLRTSKILPLLYAWPPSWPLQVLAVIHVLFFRPMKYSFHWATRFIDIHWHFGIWKSYLWYWDKRPVEMTSSSVLPSVHQWTEFLFSVSPFTPISRS